MFRSLLPAALLVAALLAGATARAEMSEINVAQQYGIGYLPLMIMEDQKLIEKHAKAAGGDVKVAWGKVAGGDVMKQGPVLEQLPFAPGRGGPHGTELGARQGHALHQ